MCYIWIWNIWLSLCITQSYRKVLKWIGSWEDDEFNCEEVKEKIKQPHVHMNDLTRYMSLEFIGNGWRREKIWESLPYRYTWIHMYKWNLRANCDGKRRLRKRWKSWKSHLKGELLTKVRAKWYSRRWSIKTISGFIILLKADLMGTKGTSVLIMWGQVHWFYHLWWFLVSYQQSTLKSPDDGHAQVMFPKQHLFPVCVFNDFLIKSL